LLPSSTDYSSLKTVKIQENKSQPFIMAALFGSRQYRVLVFLPTQRDAQLFQGKPQSINT